MRINNAGHYEYCRWATNDQRYTTHNIRNTTPIEFFQQHMVPIRKQLLDGELPSGCTECSQMEQHGKISGRQRQLLKAGVRLEQFEKTLASSPWVKEFSPGGTTQQTPQDWQIDLGNYCNGACVFCGPYSSSRLATEFKKIGIVSEELSPNWTDHADLVQRFIESLIASPHIRYLHFIGGETVLTPAFETILQALIDVGLNKTATIGFTTNLISWNAHVIELLTQFKGVHLGMSIEAFDSINDYVRWPATQEQIDRLLPRWLDLAKQHNWFVQLRTTPTVLTIHKLLTVYDYAWQNGIVVESCNFLDKPAFMRPAVLPQQYRDPIIDKMQSWIDQRPSSKESIVNGRNLSTAHDALVQDLQSYVNYLHTEQDQSDRLPALVKFLKSLEASRGNNILHCIPEYEDLFRSAGY
jgi:sulfatase maturation enzyme AslB (radical SAM superfamily)